MFTSALTPSEERALASFLLETMNKLSPPQEIDDDVISSEESEEEDETADIQNPFDDLPEKNGNDAPQDNNDNSQPSNSRVFIEGSQQSAADILSRTDPKSNITVEQLLNMHMDSLALFQDVIKTNGQVSNIQCKIQTYNIYNSYQHHLTYNIIYSSPVRVIKDIQDGKLAQKRHYWC
jgi:hypothetical protein